MSRLTGLLPASWKGITFLVKNEVLAEGGRRIVLHDYPNSNNRFVEDQGQLPPKFSITAFVTGEDFIDRAAQLERALNEEGRGVLSMPTFGVQRLWSMPFKKDASQTAVGEIRFELSFVAGQAGSGPVRIFPIPQTVYAQGDTARSKIQQSLEDLWIVPSDSPNVVSAQYDLQQYVTATQSIVSVADNGGDITQAADLIKINSPKIIRDSTDLATSFIKLWQTVSVGLSGGTGIADLLDLTKFGSELSLSLSDIKNASLSDPDETNYEIPLWNETTAERKKRNQNRLTLINSGRVAALVTAYEQVADKDYATDAEIEEVRFNIETEHQRLMRDDVDNRTLPQSQAEVRNAVEDVRISALQVLDQKEQSAFSLKTVTNQTAQSSFVQAYMLYAEDLTSSDDLTDRGIEVRKLNPTQPADKLIGDVTVLQS